MILRNPGSKWMLVKIQKRRMLATTGTTSWTTQEWAAERDAAAWPEDGCEGRLEEDGHFITSSEFPMQMNVPSDSRLMLKKPLCLQRELKAKSLGQRTLTGRQECELHRRQMIYGKNDPSCKTISQNYKWGYRCSSGAKEILNPRIIWGEKKKALWTSLWEKRKLLRTP